MLVDRQGFPGSVCQEAGDGGPEWSWTGEVTTCSEKLDECVNVLHSHLGNHRTCSRKKQWVTHTV